MFEKIRSTPSGNILHEIAFEVVQNNRKNVSGWTTVMGGGLGRRDIYTYLVIGIVC